MIDVLAQFRNFLLIPFARAAALPLLDLQGSYTDMAAAIQLQKDGGYLTLTQAKPILPI